MPVIGIQTVGECPINIGSTIKQKTTPVRGGQPILLQSGQQAAHVYTQQSSAATLLLVFDRKPP